MKYVIVAIAILIIGGLILIFNNTPKADRNTASSYTQIESDVQQGAALIDVRTPTEYAGGHIERAINLPLADIQAGVKPPVGAKIYLYCRSGNRSNQAANILKQAGYEVIDLGAIQSVQGLGAKVVGS